jgi:HSP20 family protein
MDQFEPLGIPPDFWSPFMPRFSQWPRDAATPFHILQQELHRLLDQYIGPVRFGETEARPTDLDPSSWSPPVDVYETPEDLLVAVEVPGVDPSTIDVAATGNVLTLKGVKQAGSLPEPQIQVRERLFGAFHRQITLPTEVDFDKAEATIDHGVLQIRLPKRTAAKTRTIPVRPA